MMDGVTILSTEIVNNEFHAVVCFIILFVIIKIFTILESGKFGKMMLKISAVIVFLVAIGMCFHGIETTTLYEVSVDTEKVNIKEFYDKYEIKANNGLTYTVVERDQNE